MTTTLEEIQKIASTSPEFVAMLNYLQERGQAPKMLAETLGFFRGGQYQPSTNTITFNKSMFDSLTDKENGAKAFRSIAAHEMTHAVEQNYYTRYKQIAENKKLQTPENLQWAQGFEKLIGGNPNISWPDKGADPIFDFLKQINHKWHQEKAGYRSSRSELPAHAVGMMQPPSRIFNSPDNAAPPHIDSTLATEQAILLELARRKKTNGK